MLWDERDQGGYMIDNDGEWSKIQGSQWFGSQCLKAYRKSSFGKRFENKFCSSNFDFEEKKIF